MPKYSEIKCYVKEMSLILTYEVLFDKSKVYKKSLSYCKKFRNLQQTTVINITTTVKTRPSRIHCLNYRCPQPGEFSVTNLHLDNKKTCDKWNIFQQVRGWSPEYGFSCSKCQCRNLCIVLSLKDPSAGRSDRHDYEDVENIKIVSVPRDHLPLLEYHTQSPLAPWSMATVKKTYFWPRNSDKHPFQDHHHTASGSQLNLPPCR